MRQMTLWGFAILLSACSVLPQVPTLTPTRNLSAPTLAPSPEVPIRTSGELYGDPLDGQSDPTAQALPNDGVLPPLQSGIIDTVAGESISIVLDNGETVTGALFSPETAERVPGILMLGADISSWGTLPEALRNIGNTVLVVNVPNYQNVRDDMQVYLESISVVGTVDPARIATIGTDAGADMALLGCAIYPICDAVVMLSPQDRDTLLNVLPNYTPRPLLVIAGRNDDISYATARDISAGYPTGAEFIEVATGSGTGLFVLNSDLPNSIINWLNRVWN